jgi:hypothetical protein
MIDNLRGCDILNVSGQDVTRYLTTPLYSEVPCHTQVCVVCTKLEIVGSDITNFNIEYERIGLA